MDKVKCVRCNVEMMDDYSEVTMGGMNVSMLTDNKNKKLFSSKVSDLNNRVCPKCGMVETYVVHLEKLVR